MAVQSYEIGTLLQSIQAKGQSKVSNIQSQRQALEPEYMKSQEKSAKINSVTNTILGVANSAMNVYSDYKQEQQQLKIKAENTKNKADLMSGTLGLNDVLLNMQKGLSDGLNDGSIKLVNGELDMGNVQVMSDNYGDLIRQSGMSDDVQSSLLSSLESYTQSFSREGMSGILKREEANLANLRGTAVSNSIAIDSNNLSNFDSYEQVDASIDSFGLSIEETTTQKNYAHGIIDSNRSTTLAKNIALTEGSNSAYDFINNNDKIKDRKAAKSEVNELMEATKLKINLGVEEVIKSYPTVSVNGEKFIQWDNFYEGLEKEFKDSPTELYQSALNKAKVAQGQQISQIGVFKTDEQYKLMQENELEQHLADLDSYSENGLLYGYDSLKASNEVEINKELDYIATKKAKVVASKEAAAIKHRKEYTTNLIKIPDELSTLESIDDIKAYNDELNQAYSEGKIDKNDYYKAIGTITSEYAKRNDKKIANYDKAINNIFLNNAQLASKTIPELDGWKASLEKAKEDGTFDGYEKDYATQLQGISNAKNKLENKQAAKAKTDAEEFVKDLVKIPAELSTIENIEDIKTYNTELNQAYSEGKIEKNDYFKALEDITDEYTKRYSKEISDKDEAVEDALKNNAQLALMKKPELEAWGFAIEKAESDGTFKGYEKELAIQKVAISKAKKTLDIAQVASEKAKADKIIQDDAKIEADKASLRQENIKTQKALINSTIIDYNMGTITAKEALINIDLLKDQIDDVEASKMYKSLLNTLIETNDRIPNASKALVDNFMDEIDVTIPKSLGYSSYDYDERPDVEVQQLKSHITAFVMDRYLNYDGSISELEFFNSTKDAANTLITSKIIDGKKFFGASEKEIKESKSAVFYDDELGAFRFVGDGKLEEDYRDFEVELNTELEDKGIELKAGIPSRPELDAEGYYHANPVMMGTDGTWYKKEGKDILYIKEGQKDWKVFVSKKENEKIIEKENARAKSIKDKKEAKSFLKNIGWGAM